MGVMATAVSPLTVGLTRNGRQIGNISADLELPSVSCFSSMAASLAPCQPRGSSLESLASSSGNSFRFGAIDYAKQVRFQPRKNESEAKSIWRHKARTNVQAVWGVSSDRKALANEIQSPSSGVEIPEEMQKVVGSSLGDFTRFSTEGKQAELQTAIVTYWKRGPWWDILRPEVQVDLVAAVHIADKEYFMNLQQDLDTYDRVLYEMVADKRNRRTKTHGKEVRWRPPKRRPGRRTGGGLIGSIQRGMSSVLCLDFQLECMDYSGSNWYHADLDLATFKRLQKERGESFFSFARDITAVSSQVMARVMAAPAHLGPVRRTLLWAARFVPMPLLGLFVIEGVCAPSDAPLVKAPEVRALLDLDLARALKVVLARQLTTDTMDKAASVLEKSVIIGERNNAAMEALSAALDDGCRRIAIFYGSGHLPDLDRRLRRQFALEPVGVEWRTAWAITGRRVETGGALSSVLAQMARVSGWPLNRYQTTAVLLFSLVLALDLWFWEVLLNNLESTVVQGVQILTAFLDQGWEL